MRGLFPRPATRRRLLEDRGRLLRALDQTLAEERQDEVLARRAQWLAFRGLLERAWREWPPWRDKCLAAGLRLEHLRGWEDLERVPLLEKRELRGWAAGRTARGARHGVKPARADVWHHA
jgi:hypothetical protein